VVSQSIVKIIILWYYFSMNGWIVGQKMAERPPDTLLIEPYTPSNGARGYFAARNVTESLEAHLDDPDANARALTRYIFDHDPSALNVAPSMTHRYKQSRDFMARYPDGSEKLAEALLGRLEAVHACMSEGFVPQKTNTVLSFNAHRPRNFEFEGKSAQRLNLPPVIQRRSLIWNEWAQIKIRSGELDALFCDEIFRHGAKVANGNLLPAGNLWVEVAEGIDRIREYPHFYPSDLEIALGLSKAVDDMDQWIAQDDWFVLSHIAEKGILALSESLAPGMIDGMHLTDDVYVRSYGPIVELIDLNPQLGIKGILSDGSWIYSAELARVFPEQHVSRLHDVAGVVVELGAAHDIGLPIQAMFATLNPERRAAFDEGRYRAGVAARFIDRAGMVKHLTEFGLIPLQP
jgi:hypothetical protein